MSKSRSRSILAAFACMGFMLVAATPVCAQYTTIKPDILLDTADSRTGWASQNTLTVDTQIKIDGAGSLKSVGASKDRFRKTFGSAHDVSTMRYLTFWYYVDRPDRLGGADQGQIELTSSGTFDVEEQNWSVAELRLQRGWNYVILDIPGRVRSPSSPLDLTRVNFLRVYHNPTGTVTTRIDNIVFTDRDPQSTPFSAFLELKRISKSTTAVEQQDSMFTFIMRTQPGGTERAKLCRKLRIDLTQREISAFTLTSIGVTQTAVDNETRERRWLKEFMCGERSASRNETLTHLQSRAATDIAITGELASLLNVTMAGAAETRQRLLDVDLDRIMTVCNSTPAQVDRFILDGTNPPSMSGINALVRTCTGSISQIAVLVGNRALPVGNRATAYRKCMADFTQQGAQCDNPYASPDDDYTRRINRLMYTDQQKTDLKQLMTESLAQIEAISLDEARAMSGETHPRNGAPPAERQNLENLHEQFDLERGKADVSFQREREARQQANNPPVNDVPGPFESTVWDRWHAAATAAAQRFRDEGLEHMGEMLDHLHDICVKDPQDPECNLADDEWLPTDPVVVQPGQTGQRCASMDFGDGYKTWYDRAPLGSAPRAGQINEADRIDHCMCELFDKKYGETLPGGDLSLVSNCPTPEERIAQKCLENPYDGVDGVRPECRHLMQPISMDKEAVGAKMCQKILPNCNAPYQKADGDCGCGTKIADGSGTKIPECATGIPNCPDGIPSANGCGCQPFVSGANACSKGGKDFYLTRNLTTDLTVRTFPNRPNFSAEHLLVPKTGGVRFVTPAIRKAQLFNQSTFSVRAVLPGTTYDGTGQVKVYCSNTTSGTRNQLIETIPMSSISTSSPTTLSINLSSAERTACYGSNANSNVYFEFFVDTKANQPVAFFDILGDLGDIKPPCVDFPPRPQPGPRPLNAWPTSWTFSDGGTFTPVFNGTGAIPVLPPSPTLPPVCVVDGVVVPCP